ncbi:MAG: hypothetical protein K8S98_10575 [Planctomycetes bacterium]|nr:hypothetical protein [Planctomycetota bacterium]
MLNLLLCPAFQATSAAPQDLSTRLTRVERELAKLGEASMPLSKSLAEAASGEPWYERFTVGGYGEIHYNQPQSGGNQIDIHRFVLYLGYRFDDWISLHSETEIEHAFVEEGNGEIVLEQMYVEFALDADLSVRVGRVLAPLGIINQRHEPPTFQSVERPAVETVILPSTWTLDGVGVAGRFSPSLSYQAYLTNGLDGAGFSALDGLRGGRQEERPGVTHASLSGRLDWFPLDSLEHDLRLGLGAFGGDVDNGDEGTAPGVDADVVVVAGDFDYGWKDLEFRGVYAWEDIDGAAELSNVTGETVASRIEGWYLESAWRCLPERWKTGRLAEAEGRLFVRYEDFDTQAEVPTGFAANPAGDRNQWVFGVSFHPNPSVVLKADLEVRDDAAGAAVPERFNLGIGWSF